MFQLDSDVYTKNRQAALSERLGNQSVAASQQEMQLKQPQIQGANLDLAQKKIETSLQLLATATDQPSYENAKQQAQTLGIDVTNLPPQYDPQYVQRTQMQLLTAKDRLTAATSNPLAFSSLLGGNMLPNSAPLSTAPQIPGGAVSANATPQAPAAQNPASGFVTGITPKDDGRNWEVLRQLPPQYQPLIKSISEGGAMPGNIGRSSSQGLQLMSLAGQFDPTFNGDITHTERNTTSRDYSPGGKSGQSILALNQGIGHLDALFNSIDDLHNTGNTYWNSAANAFTSGFRGNSAQAGNIATFNTLKKNVADELTRIWRGTGGAEADIQERLKVLDDSKSPTELKAALAATADLLGSRIGSLEDNYKRAMGPAAKEQAFITSPSNIMLKKLRGDQITPAEQKQLDAYNQRVTGGAPSNPNLSTPIRGNAPTPGSTVNWNDF